MQELGGEGKRWWTYRSQVSLRCSVEARRIGVGVVTVVEGPFAENFLQYSPTLVARLAASSFVASPRRVCVKSKTPARQGFCILALRHEDRWCLSMCIGGMYAVGKVGEPGVICFGTGTGTAAAADCSAPQSSGSKRPGPVERCTPNPVRHPTWPFFRPSILGMRAFGSRIDSAVFRSYPLRLSPAQISRGSRHRV